MRRTLIACVVVALLVGGGTATASGLITGSDIKNGSVTGADIKKDSIAASDLSQSLRNRLNTTVSGSPGAPGQQGAKGDTGAAGPKGDKGAQGEPGLNGNGLPGPKGDKGEPGANGTNGADGAPGTPGAKGEPGAKGDPGAKGEPGAKGADGTNGVDGAKGEKGDKGDTGPAGMTLVEDQSPTTRTSLDKIGGPIATGVTKLSTAITLQPGSYLVAANGVFYRKAADPDAPLTYGVLVLWLDKNDDGVYDWQTNEGAGTAFTPALPANPQREASTSQTRVVTVGTATKLYLGGFGYNHDQSGYGTDPDGFEVSPSLSVVKLG